MDLRVHPRHPGFSETGHPLQGYHPAVGRAGRFRDAVERFVEHYRGVGMDAIAAAEARGFLFAAPLALALKCR